MPGINEINKFKSHLNSLSNESSMLEEIGEKIEDIPPPESAIDQDLSDLLGTAFSPDEEADDQSQEAAPEEDLSTPAFDEDFNFSDDADNLASPIDEPLDESFNEPPSGISDSGETDIKDGDPGFSDESDLNQAVEDSFSESESDPFDVSALSGIDDDQSLESGSADIPEDIEQVSSEFDDLFGGDEDSGTNDSGTDADEAFGDSDFSDPFSEAFQDDSSGSLDDPAAADTEDVEEIGDDLSLEDGSGGGEEISGGEETKGGEDLFGADVDALNAGLIDEPAADQGAGSAGASDDDGFGDIFGDGENPFEDIESDDFSNDADPFGDFDQSDFGIEDKDDGAAAADTNDFEQELSQTDDIFPQGSADESASGDIDGFGELDGIGDLGGPDELPSDITDTTVDAEEEFGAPIDEASSGSAPGSDDIDFGVPDDLSSPEGAEEGSSDELNLFDDSEAAADDFIFDSVEGFDEPDADGSAVDDSGFSDSDFPSGFGMEEESLDGGDLEEFEDVDSFDLGDLGDGFGFDSDEAQLGTSGPADEDVISADASPAGQISDEDFKALQEALNKQPRNLKIAAEEALADPSIPGSDIKKLLDALIGHKPVKEIGAIVSRLTGKKIKIPAQYEKLSGQLYESERSTFAYAFRHNILPIVINVVIACLILGMLGLVGYGYVYRPIQASILYNRGMDEIEAGRHAEGNEFFVDAKEFWPSKKQYFRYADKFIEKRQYLLAEMKYEQFKLDFSFDRNLNLEYAELRSVYQSRYGDAEDLLKVILEYKDGNLKDPDAILAMGDNYMRWAKSDPEKYELARQRYIDYAMYHGKDFDFDFRFIHYLIETDKQQDVIDFKEDYKRNPKKNIDPQAFAEMAGYLMDKRHYTGISDVLDRAKEADTFVPEVHYQFSRYYRYMDAEGEEKKALNATLDMLSYRSRLSNREKAVEIDTYNRLGENLYKNGEALQAQSEFEKAEELYETARATRIVDINSKFGKIYANLGDVHYYAHNDYDLAMQNYIKAEDNLYKSRDIDYKQGYILYSKKEYPAALKEFYSAEDVYNKNTNLMYALGNTFFLKNSNSIALGYYMELRDRLEEELSSISFLLVEERTDHYSLIRNLVNVYNNLGVAHYMQYLKNGNIKNKNDALFHFVQSLLYSDKLTRDSETLERGEPEKRKAYDNYAIVNAYNLYQVQEGDLQIHMLLGKDMDTYAIR